MSFMMAFRRLRLRVKADGEGPGLLGLESVLG